MGCVCVWGGGGGGGGGGGAAAGGEGGRGSEGTEGAGRVCNMCGAAPPVLYQCARPSAPCLPQHTCARTHLACPPPTPVPSRRRRPVLPLFPPWHRPQRHRRLTDRLRAQPDPGKSLLAAAAAAAGVLLVLWPLLVCPGSDGRRRCAGAAAPQHPPLCPRRRLLERLVSCRCCRRYSCPTERTLHTACCAWW